MTSARVACVLLLGLCWSALVSCEESLNATEFNEPDFKIPEYILPCSRKDPKIEVCMQNSLNHMRPYLVKGIPELDVPPLEPLVIPEMKIENGQGPVRVRAFFSNITALGAGNYNITKVRVNLPAYRFDIHLTFPKIELEGKYDIDGNVLLFPIKSHGDFWALFGNVTAIGRLQSVEQVKDGVRYLIIGRMLVNFDIGQAKLRIADQLNGDNVIGQAMNQFLNQNVNEIIDEMRPAASFSIAKHFKEFINTGFSKLPMKMWLRDT